MFSECLINSHESWRNVYFNNVSIDDTLVVPSITAPTINCTTLNAVVGNISGTMSCGPLSVTGTISANSNQILDTSDNLTVNNANVQLLTRLPINAYFTQNTAVIYATGAADIVTFGTTIYANGISITGTNTQIVLANVGYYKFSFTTQYGTGALPASLQFDISVNGVVDTTQPGIFAYVPLLSSNWYVEYACYITVPNSVIRFFITPTTNPLTLSNGGSAGVFHKLFIERY